MVNFGVILTTIGDFGVFQKLVLAGLAYQNFLTHSFLSSFIFVQLDPERHCNTDWILRADPNLTMDEQLSLTLPREENGTFSRCRMFVPVNWNISVIRELKLNETTGCQNGWVYYNTEFEATIITDFHLVCDKSAMTDVVQTVFMCGSLFGAIVFGPVAESFGRRRTTQLQVIVLLIFIIVAGVSPNVYVYMMTQFINGAAFAGTRITAIVLATEWTGVTKRSLASFVCLLWSSLGQCASAFLMYLVRDWRTVQYIAAGAQVVVCLYIWWTPESARWLLQRGKTEEAYKIIRTVAAVNKKDIPEDLLLGVTQEQHVESGGIKTLFTSKTLIKYLLILSFAWFSLNLGYFCVILNVGGFGLSIFLVQFLFGITEVPAYCLSCWLLEKVGRRKCLVSSLLMGGTLSLLTVAIPKDNAVGVTALITTGKFFFASGGPICTVYLQELFPTSVRQTAVGLGTMAFRTGAMLSPLLNMLAVYHHSIPTIVFSSLVTLSGVFAILLPETNKTELSDSVDVADFSRPSTTKKCESDSTVAEITCTKSTKF